MNDLFKIITQRRTFYGIGNKIEVSDERLEEIVKDAVLHTPSPFNSQSSRVVLLLGKEHLKLWDIVLQALKAIVPESNFADTKAKIDGFSSGYGTVLFFEDKAVVDSLQQNNPLYAEKFPVWSQNSSGMLQYVMWLALEHEGLGASLQHYNPLIDQAVAEAWDLPSTWVLGAQMPFGNITAPAGAKEFMPIEQRVKLYK